nr:MAG: VP5 [Reoviridae sp.]
MTLRLWNYLEHPEKYLQTLLPGIDYTSDLDVKSLSICRAFGRRLERLYTVGKSKFHPNLLNKLRRSNHCGIYLYSRKNKEQVTKRLVHIGWPRHAKFRFMNEFPRHNYFDQICIFDVVIFTGGLIPTEIDVYCLFNEEMVYGRKKGIMQKDHHVYLLTKAISTYISGFNPFNKIDLNQEIIGIGGQLRGLPDWYRTLEMERDQTLFDANDQPILLTISKYYVRIGCYIPGCTNIQNFEVKYWHAHNDPNYPKLSLENFARSKTHTLVNFGCGYNVLCLLENGTERRITVPVELYDYVFGSIDNATGIETNSLPEELMFMYSSPNGKRYRLSDSNLKRTSILARVNLRSLESRRNLVNVFHTAIANRERPHLVLISPKGTFKSTFIKIMQKRNASIGFLDSDEFGVEISKAYFQENIPSFVINPDDNFIINWFRSKLPEFEVSIESFSPSQFRDITRLEVYIDEFSSFWKEVFDKGYGDVPCFYDYVNRRLSENSKVAMHITMTHNLFEARLCQSKMILGIECGIDLQDVIIRRAIFKNKTVSQFLADELYQKYCLSSLDLQLNSIGWGDLFVASLDLGVDTITREQVCIH